MSTASAEIAGGGALEIPAALAAAARDFVGRDWVLTAIDRWLGEGGERRLLVTGAAGTGKSTLAARLVQLSRGNEPGEKWPRLGGGAIAAAHFCSARVDQTLDPRRVFERLSVQLAARYPAFRDALHALRDETGVAITLRGSVTAGVAEAGSSLTGVRIDMLDVAGLTAREAFDRFLRRPLEALCAQIDAPIVLLVDSLDESLTYGGDRTLPHVLRAATDASEELPVHVRLILTSRPDPRAIERVADKTIDLIADAPPDDHDVRDYALRRLKGTPLDERERADLAERIAQAGAGNFLYASYVLDDLLAHEHRLSDPAAIGLPSNLTGHYREFLQRELAADERLWRERYQPVLGALAVARGQGLTPSELSGALELRRSEIDGVLRAIAQYLTAPAEGRVRVYHQSFRDFLLSDEECNVYPGEASDRLAAFLLNENAGAWLQAKDPYAVLQTPSHLVEALTDAEHRRDRVRLTDDLLGLLTDLGYLTARLRLERGQLGGLEHDYLVAAATVSEGPAAILAEYADAVRREGHVLQERPNDLFVQIVNRLLGTIASIHERAMESEAKPRHTWLLALHPLPLERALRRTLARHTETTQSVSVTPDGTRAASASWDRTVCVWDVEEGRLIRQWEAGAESLNAVMISPDGREAITLDSAGRVARWDAITGRELPRPTATRTAAVAVTPDWRAVLLANSKGTVAMHELANRRRLRSWKLPGPVSSLASTLDGTMAATGGIVPVLARGWRLDGTEPPVRFGAPVLPDDGEDIFGQPHSNAVSFSGDGRLLAVGATNGLVWLWEVSGPRLLWTCRAERIAVNAVAVTEAEGLVLAGGVQGTIAVIDASSGDELTRLRGGTGQVIDLALTQDGATLLSASGEGDVRVWDVARARSSSRQPGHADEVTAIAVSPDGSLAVSGSADGTLAVWSLPTGERLLPPVAAHAGTVRCAAFRPDGLLLSAGEDGRVVLWNAKELAQLGAIESGHNTGPWQNEIRALALMNGQRALAGRADGRLLEVDVAAGTVTPLDASGDSPLTALRVSRDHRFAVSGRADGAVERWSLGDGRAIPELVGTVSEVRSLVLVEDESRVLVGDLHGVITSFSIDGETPPARLRGHVNYVDGLAMVAGGRLLLSGGWDRTLRLWDLATGEVVCRYTWEVPIARATAMTRDGRDFVVVGDRQGAVFFMTLEKPDYQSRLPRK